MPERIMGAIHRAVRFIAAFADEYPMWAVQALIWLSFAACAAGAALHELTGGAR